MDKIKITNLEVFARHGVFPEENVLGQKFLVSAVLYTDTRTAGKTDELTASIHYGEVCQFIDTYLKEHTFQLIERVAESLAKALLLSVPRLEKIRLEIKKPWAPVGLPLDTVSVEIERRWHTAYVALGSNMGDREEYIRLAVLQLNEEKDTYVTKESPLYETPPYGVVDQADFLNGCVEIRTLLTPEELLEKLHKIEKNAHRERLLRWGPRTLDLDIIFYDDEVVEKENLCIPHVEMHKRNFVLEPLKDIAPYKRHPVIGKTVWEMFQEMTVS